MLYMNMLLIFAAISGFPGKSIDHSFHFADNLAALSREYPAYMTIRSIFGPILFRNVITIDRNAC